MNPDVQYTITTMDGRTIEAGECMWETDAESYALDHSTRLGEPVRLHVTCGSAWEKNIVDGSKSGHEQVRRISANPSRPARSWVEHN